MNDAYIDTSIVVAIEFDELNVDVYANQIRQYSKLYSSNFLEAEFKAVCKREQHTASNHMLLGIDWKLPGRLLTNECIF